MVSTAMELPLEASIQEPTEPVNVASTAMELPPEVSIQETDEPAVSSKSSTHILNILIIYDRLTRSRTR